ncbi:MAG: GAF domain-containing protein [Anaerolineales bacterium]|nr:GAF domain-containing protein [Anaerolineales bacterium]
MIETMLDNSERTSRSIDILQLGMRGLWFTAMPLAAVFQDALSVKLAILITGWASLSVAMGVANAVGRKKAWQGYALTFVDVLFAFLAVLMSGMLTSPLWWCALIGPVHLMLEGRTRQARLLVGFQGAGLGIVSISILGPGSGALFPFGIHLAGLLVSAGVMEWLSGSVRGEATRVAESQQRLQRERQVLRVVSFQGADLNSLLDENRLADMVLDLCMQALNFPDADSRTLISALLFLEEGNFTIKAARRLSIADRRHQLPADSGVLHLASEKREAADTDHIAADQALSMLDGLVPCHSALALPVFLDEQFFGVLLFAHPRKEFFTTARRRLLAFVAQQGALVMKNAYLYREMKQEKDRLAEVQEETRRKLARDLHDGPTQTMAAIAMRVNFAKRMLIKQPEKVSDELDRIEDMARATTKEIRHMLFTLRPLILESQGLGAALAQLGEKIEVTHGQSIRVQADRDAARGLSGETQVVMFYIAEEAVNNACKHAAAEQVQIRLIRQAHGVVMEIKDDGVGFSVGAVDDHYEQSGSLGMVNMRERAEMIGGTLQIETDVGRGTRVTLLVPFADREDVPGEA